MRSGFQQNDFDDFTGLSLSGSFRKTVFGYEAAYQQDGLFNGQSFDGSSTNFKSDFQQNDQDISSAQSFDGSLRKSNSGVCKGTSGFLSSNKLAPISKKEFNALKYCARNLLELDPFTQALEDWILENSLADSTYGVQSFNSPFQMDELRELDFALEGILFHQLSRMPCSFHDLINLKEDEYFALEDFLHTTAEGLWRTFWHKNKQLPFFVSCARHPWSKFYTVDKAISRGRIADLCGAALMSKSRNDLRVNWDQVVQFALFKPDIMLGNKLGLSSTTLCEALFYGFHILLSRRLSKHCTISGDSVFIIVLDSKFGGVVRLTGDIRQLELNSAAPYEAVVEWIKVHSEVNLSPVDRIWNKLGNTNWGDLGTLQLLLATFYSIVQCHGPPRRSIASLASAHSLRLQKRRMEYQCHLMENRDGLGLSKPYSHPQGEIVELKNANNLASMNHESRLRLQEGDVIEVDDQQQGRTSFHIQESLVEGKSFYYSAISLENPTKLLTLYVGAHPSRLEPSWEDMSLWYQVQRHTKMLNVLKQAGTMSKNLPEIVASGKILHPGICRKQSPEGTCDHPWCGTPVLVTFPVGEPLSYIVAQDGPFSSDEVIRCCRDCLAALRSAKTSSIQHGDICPENVIRVSDSQGSSGSFLYVPISWGRAVLEDRDSPAINLLFSSSHALQHGKLCPSSDAESLVYLLYFLSGGSMQQQDSIESALQWRQRCWVKRLIQQQLGEVSALLKAFADYVDSLCGTPYPVDYDGWVNRLDKAVIESAGRGRRLSEQMGSAMRIRVAAGTP